MSFDQRRPFHEKFAEGFEQYLFDGKAPTVELRGIFQRMSAWLKQVYTHISGLGIELTPEVRGVMDRLIATDAEISAAENSQGYTPAFGTKPDWLNDDQWAAYQRLGDQATADATDKLQARSLRDMQWLEGAKSRALKKLQAENAGLRKGVRDEVSARVLAEPVNKARDFLKFGKINGDKVEGAHRLSLPEMKAMHPLADESFFKQFGYGKYGMLGEENAIDPEQAADLLGYNSGRELAMIRKSYGLSRKLRSMPRTFIWCGLSD